MRITTTELVEAKRDERGRRITPAAEREAVVRAYEQSGLTQKAFARRGGDQVPDAGLVAAAASARSGRQSAAGLRGVYRGGSEWGPGGSVAGRGGDPGRA